MSDSDHLYEFIYKNQYGIEERIVHPYMNDELSTNVCTVGYLLLYKDMTFMFHFDFGADWKFKIQVEAMPSAESNYSELTVIEKHGTPPEQYPNLEDDYEDND